MSEYLIANQRLHILLKEEHIHKNFVAFKVTDSNSIIDLTVSYKEEGFPSLAQSPLVETGYMSVTFTHDCWYIEYSNPTALEGSCYDPKNKTLLLFLNPLKPDQQTVKSPDNYESNLTVTDYISLAIRDVFLILCQQKNMIVLHSSSILYEGKAYLFSAPSGTGKTTHTNMWVKKYGVTILDGDLAACSIEQGQAFAYGLPWCGASERFVNEKAPIGNIIFLAQRCHNEISKLNSFESIISITSRCLTPTWTKEMMNKNLSFAQMLANTIPCLFLSCLPNEEAMELVKTYIDQH